MSARGYFIVSVVFVGILVAVGMSSRKTETIPAKSIHLSSDGRLRQAADSAYRLIHSYITVWNARKAAKIKMMFVNPRFGEAMAQKSLGGVYKRLPFRDNPPLVPDYEQIPTPQRLSAQVSADYQTVIVISRHRRNRVVKTQGSAGADGKTHWDRFVIMDVPIFFVLKKKEQGFKIDDIIMEPDPIRDQIIKNLKEKYRTTEVLERAQINPRGRWVKPALSQTPTKISPSDPLVGDWHCNVGFGEEIILRADGTGRWDQYEIVWRKTADGGYEMYHKSDAASRKVLFAGGLRFIDGKEKLQVHGPGETQSLYFDRVTTAP